MYSWPLTRPTARGGGTAQRSARARPCVCSWEGRRGHWIRLSASVKCACSSCSRAACGTCCCWGSYCGRCLILSIVRCVLNDGRLCSVVDSSRRPPWKLEGLLITMRWNTWTSYVYLVRHDSQLFEIIGSSKYSELFVTGVDGRIVVPQQEYCTAASGD